MSRDLDKFVADMNRLSNTLAKTPHDVVSATARTYTNAVRQEIRSVAPTGRLRGVGRFNRGKRQGARVGVKYDVKDAGTRSTAIVQATGPLHLIERNTKAHTIPRTVTTKRLRTAAGRLSHKRESTGRAVSGRRVLYVGGRFVTGPIRHPGTKGKHPFARAVKRVERQAVADASRELANAITRTFK
jgi:hypothetical protein